MADKKYRAFCGILYPDSTSYDFDEIINLLDVVFDKWAYITHDRDLTDQGEVKKLHVHWVGYRKNPVMLKTIAKQMDLRETEVEWAKRGWQAVARYLIHLEQPEKAQYEPEEVTANFEYTTVLCDEMSAEDKARGIMAYIMETDNINLLHLGRWSLDSGFWSEFLRAMPYWKLLVQERQYMRGKNEKEKG